MKKNSVLFSVIILALCVFSAAVADDSAENSTGGKSISIVSISSLVNWKMDKNDLYQVMSTQGGLKCADDYDETDGSYMVCGNETEEGDNYYTFYFDDSRGLLYYYDAESFVPNSYNYDSVFSGIASGCGLNEKDQYKDEYGFVDEVAGKADDFRSSRDDQADQVMILTGYQDAQSIDENYSNYYYYDLLVTTPEYLENDDYNANPLDPEEEKEEISDAYSA